MLTSVAKQCLNICNFGKRAPGNSVPFHCVYVTHVFIGSLPEYREQEERGGWCSQVSLDGLDVVEELAALRGADQGQPQNADSTHEQDERSETKQQTCAEPI